MVTTPSPTMPGSGGVGTTPQGPSAALGIPDTQDYPRLVFTAPYFEQVPLAELIAPSVQEATEALLPTLVPPYVQDAANTAVQQSAVLLTGSTMTGALFLNPVMPTQPSQAASMAYVDALVATAGIPEVPPTPVGQLWGRETGQWVPINLESGVFLPLAGGVMGGQINMSGNSIINLAPVPQMPYGAAPAQWVLNQIAASSLYQGTWNADTNTPDLTLSGLWQNGFTWLVVTSNPSGVVVSETIPGLTGNTVYDGNTILYSTVDGAFAIVGGAALTVDQANALYLQLIGGQMSGNLLLNANATQAMQATTLQQVQALIAASVFPEPPNDGQTYGRNGLQLAWLPVLGTAGGVLTGPLTLAGNVTGALQAVPLQQVQSLITAGVASYLPLAGGALTGPLTTTSTITIGSASASTPAPLTVGGQGISYLTLGAIGQNIAFAYTGGQLALYQNGTNQPLGFLPLATGGTLNGNLTLSGTNSLSVGGTLGVTGATTLGALTATGLGVTGATTLGALTAAGATMTGPVVLPGDATAALQAVPLEQVENFTGANIGRNYIHNPLMRVNQRAGTTYTMGASAIYAMDRWCGVAGAAGDTYTVSYVACTDADRAAIGNENAFVYANCVFTGGTGASNQCNFQQRIEEMRRVSNKACMLSFWAYSPSSLRLGVGFQQIFGSGGSPSPSVGANIGVVQLTTGWQRYSLPVTFPSVAGMTFGTTANTNFLQIAFYLSAPAANSVAYGLSGNLGNQSGTINIWGVQLEVGSVATPLEQRDPEIELALCQRFCQSFYFSASGYNTGASNWPTNSLILSPQMRATPTVTAPSGVTYSGAVTSWSLTPQSIGSISPVLTYSGAGVGQAWTSQLLISADL